MRKQTLTAKLKLGTTPEQYRALRDTQLAYRDALNHVSAYSFNFMNRSANKVRIQEHTYYDLRARFGLPAQMAINGSRQVGATYKGLWTKVRKNVEHRKMGLTKRRFKGLDKPPRYASPKLLYTYGRGFPFLNGRSETEQGSVSVKTLTVRVVVPYEGYNEHLPLVREGSVRACARRRRDRWRRALARGAQGCVLLARIPHRRGCRPRPTQNNAGNGRGRGAPCPRDGGGYRHLRKVPQRRTEEAGKGHPCTTEEGAPAKRHPQIYGFPERQATALHRAQAASYRQAGETANAGYQAPDLQKHHRRQPLYPYTPIGVEDLTDIRERTDGRKFKKASNKRKKSNKQRSTWPFAELRSLLTYKATFNGSVVIAVDADYTSQGCPKCGHTSRADRPARG